MASVFISMPGHQIMGTLQPWLAFNKRQKEPAQTFLLYTPGVRGTEDVAQRLADFSIERDICIPELIQISTRPSGPDSAPGIVRQIVAEAMARGDEVCFNVDGGMNYLICVCVLELTDLKPMLITASQWKIVLFDWPKYEFFSCLLPDPLPVQTILDLQGVAYDLNVPNPDAFPPAPFLEYCEKNKIALPPNHLKNVGIGGIVFDVVWNPGTNRLCFLKDWRFDISSMNEIKDRERNFTDWSANRKRVNELYDKDVFALVRDEKSEQRLRTQSGGHISPCLLSQHNYAKNRQQKQLWEDDLREFLKNGVFGRKAKGGKVRKLEPGENCGFQLRDSTLVVCIGSNFPSTMQAVAAHKPENLALCFTPADAQVKEAAQRIRDLAPELGLASVELIPWDIEGTFPEESLPKTGGVNPETIDVNITPGAKGQGAMLARWAKKRGFTVWSLKNALEVASPIYNPYDKPDMPYQSWDPALLFRIAGAHMVDEGLRGEELAAELPAYKALLDFIAQAIEAGRMNDLFHRPVELGGSLLHRPQYGRWELRQGKKTLCALEVAENGKWTGKWFERLCAAALLLANDKIRVRLNPKLGWDEDTENEIISKNNLLERPFQAELDVIASYQGNLILVSCKGILDTAEERSIEEKKKDAATEAARMAVNLGRFGLPMLAHTVCGEAYMHEDNVMVIGWRELCQPKTLLRRIGDLAKAKRSTD